MNFKNFQTARSLAGSIQFHLSSANNAKTPIMTRRATERALEAASDLAGFLKTLIAEPRDFTEAQAALFDPLKPIGSFAPFSCDESGDEECRGMVGCCKNCGYYYAWCRCGAHCRVCKCGGCARDEALAV